MSTTAIAREMAAAGPGCAIANGLLNAFETTKVKLQLHNTARPVYHTATPWGVMQQIIQQEGLVRGLLTPGLSASLTRSLLYGAYRVGLYTSTREWLSARPEPQWSHRMLSGMATGGLGALVSCRVRWMWCGRDCKPMPGLCGLVFTKRACERGGRCGTVACGRH